MSGSLRTDVCVVGGGPAGAATAWKLAQAGVNVVLLDRAKFPRDKPCAEYLSPQASRILAAMGVLHELEPRASRLRGMRVRSPRGDWLRGDFRGAHRYRGFRDEGLAIRRTVLDSVLLAAAEGVGVRVLQQTRVRDLSRSGGRITGVVAFAGPGELRVDARLVIGADGLRSVVARRMGVARRLRWPGRIALIAHYAGVRGMTDYGEMHVDADGYFGLATVGELTNVAVVIPLRAAAGIAGTPDAFLERWIRTRPYLRERFIGAERAEPVRATGPFATRVTRSWMPGAAVVGDAADFYDPFTGEGIYAALRGAELLVPSVLRALESGADERSALVDYDRARRREFSGKWKVERAVSIAVALPALMNHVTAALSRRSDLADLLVGVCGDFVPAQELFRRRFLLPLLLGEHAGAAA